jgi:hypothetical protein
MGFVELQAAMLPLAHAHHTVTFRRIELAPFLVRVARLPQVTGSLRPRLASLACAPGSGGFAHSGIAISNATRKIAAAALKHF